jgi:DNA-directed RNA polymerase specialized sigma24 family protein
MATSRAPLFGLTAGQKKQYDSVVPREVNRAAAHVIREYHVDQQADDLKQEGTIAIATGIPRFDPSFGIPFEQWAFFCALHAMLQIVRVENRYRQQFAAMRLAVTLHGAFSTGTFNAARDDEDIARTKLTDYARRLATGTIIRLVMVPIATRGEDDVVVAETQRRVVHVMKRLLSELSPEQRDLLTTCFAYDDGNVKKWAHEHGKGYRAVLEDYHELIDLLAARFAGAGFKELPPWPADASGTILGSPGA